MSHPPVYYILCDYRRILMNTEHSPCLHCPLRNTCAAPCDALSRLLPREEHARAHRLYRKGAAAFARALERGRAETRLMLEHRGCLSGRMAQVFRLYYDDGLTTPEIARRLGVNTRTAGRYLERARARIARRVSGCVRRRRRAS
jgi:DNA-directed RNA polymerase specialized sigma24 family protein